MSHAPTDALRRRHHLVREAAAAERIDAVVVTSLPNILYLTNFSGSSAVVDYSCGGAGFGHLGDLLQRTPHRNRVFNNLFRVRFQVVSRRTVVIDPAAEGAGTRQRFRHPTPSCRTAAPAAWRRGDASRTAARGPAEPPC